MKDFAGLSGPNYAWVANVTLEEPDPNFNFAVGALRLVITAHRPDGTTVSWDSDQAQVSFTSRTATSFTARHTLASDGSDLPFIGTGRVCKYRFTFLCTLDGEAVELEAVSRTYYNKDYPNA